MKDFAPNDVSADSSASTKLCLVETSTVAEAMHVGRQGVCGRPLHLILSFVVNLKLPKRSTI